jgi:hypothetical protein
MCFTSRFLFGVVELGRFYHRRAETATQFPNKRCGWLRKKCAGACWRVIPAICDDVP